MNKFARQLLPFASLILLLLFLSIKEHETFLTWSNFLNVFRRSSPVAIIAVGMTMVIVSAGIDLSVGSMLALSGMVGALVMSRMGESIPAVLVGSLAGVATGALCGFLNGFLITQVRLAPFIVTLGTMSVFRGVSYVMNDGQPYNVPEYRWLGEGLIFGIPVSILIFLFVSLAAGFLMKYSRLGRYTYAIGSNREAAFHAGINVNGSLMAIYAITGFLTGLAALIQTSRTVSAQPTAGQQFELDTIAAVVIGGASLSGGRGTILGTIIGTLLISFLRNGCTLLGISTNIQLIVIGIIIIAAVSVDQIARARVRA